MNNILNRFLKYVDVCTTSDDSSSTFPSSPFQLAFADALASECRDIGLLNVNVDKFGYVSAHLPANINKPVKKIAFIAHMDTSPDACGLNIKPVITENYKGEVIKLNNIELSPEEFPSLKNHIGDTIISSDGRTLLGADDKAGIAEIMTAVEYIIEKDIPHGDIVILFTPDEEIGKGVDHLNVDNLEADFGFTIDGGAIGELEYENFNAAAAEITIIGKSVHPGTAKNIMLNATLISSEFMSLLPKNETPATTEGYEGFYHLTDIIGNVSKSILHYIIRDFEKDSFEKRKTVIKNAVNIINSKYGNIADIKLYDQYNNMREIIEKDMSIIELAKKSMKDIGVNPLIQPIRGGTDGARLSFMGLPCPNIFTGGYNFHGPYEYIPLGSMIKAVEVIVKIAENNTKAVH